MEDGNVGILAHLYLRVRQNLSFGAIPSLSTRKDKIPAPTRFLTGDGGSALRHTRREPMKNQYAAGAGLLLFAGGLMIGREVVPNVPDTPSATEEKPLSARTPSRRRIAEPSPLPSGETSGVLDLVDNQDLFGTNRNLGKALEKLDADALLTLLKDLESSSKNDPKFHTARSQIFNYLALADPGLAMETLMSSDDASFKHAQIATVIRYLAKEDFSAARAAVESIEDQRLLGSARSSLATAAIEYAPNLLPELLKDSNQLVAHQTIHYGSWGSHNRWNNWGWGNQVYYPVFNQNSVISQWAVKDPAAAEAFAHTIEDPNQRAGALSGIAAARAQTDPDGALAWAEGLTNSSARDQAMRSVLSSMANKDPHRVAEMLDSIQNPGLKQSLMTTVAHQLITTDQAAGLAWINKLPAGNIRNQALGSAIGQIAQKDPASAALLIEELPPNVRKNNMSQLASTWAHQDLEGARAWLGSIENPFEQQTVLEGIIGPWALSDPEGAAAYLKNSDLPAQLLSNHFGTIASQWANKDPEAAMQWAHEIEDPQGRQRALSSAYHNWAAKDPAAAAQQLGTVREEDRATAISSIVSNWSSRDPDALMQWMEGLTTEERINNASTIIGGISYNRPQEAAAWLERLATEAAGDENLSGQIKSQAGSLVSNWSNSDVEAAADWALNLPDEEMRNNALNQVAQNWARMDPIGASDWIDDLPEGKARDQGVRELANQFKHIDPATAYEWSQSVTEDSNRTYSMREVLGEWKKTDPEAARQAYESSDLTEKQREQMDYLFR